MMQPSKLKKLLRHCWPRSFRAQVVLLTAGMVTSSILALSFYNTRELVAHQYLGTEQRLGAIAQNLAFGGAHALLVRDHSALEQLLLQAANYPGVRSLAIIDPAHRVLSEVLRVPGQAPHAAYDYRTLPAPRGSGTQYEWRYGAQAHGLRLAGGLDATALVVWHPIQEGRLGWLRIETSVDDIKANALQLIRDSALFTLLALALSALALFWLLRPNLRALAEATDFARVLTKARGRQMQVHRQSTEIEQLALALNETSLRLYVQETALNQAKALLANVLEAASEVSIIACDAEGVIVVFNSGAERLLGYTAQEIVGQQTPAIFHLPAEVVQRGDELSTQLGYAVAGFRAFVEIPELQGVEQREWTYVRKNGEQVPVSLVITTMRAGDTGQITGYLGIAQDITQRKAAETALRDQAEHTQAILDTILDGIITINEAGVIMACNPAAERIFGYALPELLGRNVSMLMPNPHRDAHDGYLRNYLATGVARIIGIGREVEGQRKDGSLFPMDLSLSVISRQGCPQFVGLVRDISERKRVERLKTEFVSTVSHELRTPLTSISGALGLIVGGTFGAMPEKAQQMVGIAHKNSLRLTFLINDLLDMEKLVAGKMHFDLQQQKLQPLLEQALETNRTFGAERRVNLVLMGAASDIEVAVDSQRLLQVMSNLISNAIKYSPEDGTVEIAIALQGTLVRVTVSDHGPGIPAAFHARIFQKFSQADSSDTRQKGGTGLGLAITRELVERMGGRIGFSSEEGQGAHFHFELPNCKAMLATVPLELPSAMPSDAPRILVVEDEPDIAHLLGLMLRRAGYVVDIAGSGAAALAAVQQARYDAATMDLMLPDISGLEVIHQLRQRPETENLPIIVVSAKVQEGRLTLNSDISGIDWLSKPFDESRLLAALGKQLPQALERCVRVLHVEDDADLHQVIRATIGERFHVELATTLHEAEARILAERFDVVILDISLPDGSGWALLPTIRARQPQARVVILSGENISPEEIATVEAALLKSQISGSELLDAISRRIRLPKEIASTREI